MDIEEAKEFLELHGYKVIKETIRKPMPQLSPCVCGCKLIYEWFSSGGYFRQCSRCGLSSPTVRTKREARNRWNETVQSAKKKG